MPYKDIEKRRKNAREYAKRTYPKRRIRRLELHANWRNKIKAQVISYYSKGANKCGCSAESQ